MEEKFFINNTEYFTAIQKNESKSYFLAEKEVVIYRVSIWCATAYIQAYKLENVRIFSCNGGLYYNGIHKDFKYKIQAYTFRNFFTEDKNYTGTLSTELLFDKNKHCIHEGYFIDFQRALKFFNKTVKKCATNKKL